MSAPPLLSVALPVRNGANFLVEALDSILAQDLAGFELHVSDNASDDATPAILADYAARDPRVKVSRSEELLPLPVNMARAVRLTRSRWVKLFCHDDLMRPDCLSRITAAIGAVEGSNVGLIGNGERYLFGNGFMTAEEPDGPLERVPGREAIARKLWATSRPLALPAITTATVRRDVFEASGGFDPRFVYFDTIAWLRLLTRADYAFVPASLTVNRIHGGQVATQAQRALRNVEDFRAFLPEFLEQHGEALGIGALARARVRLVPPAIAARSLAMQWAAGRRRLVGRMLGGLPVAWWPLLAPLTLRALAQERDRRALVEGKVPRALLYPQ